MGHKEHAATVCFFLDSVAGLLLGADEKNAFPGGYGIDQELISGVEKPDGALEIYDINPVAGTKDERFHFGVPPARLVAEMDPASSNCFIPQLP